MTTTSVTQAHQEAAIDAGWQRWSGCTSLPIFRRLLPNVPADASSNRKTDSFDLVALFCLKPCRIAVRAEWLDGQIAVVHVRDGDQVMPVDRWLWAAAECERLLVACFAANSNRHKLKS